MSSCTTVQTSSCGTKAQKWGSLSRDVPKEECAVVAVLGSPDAPRLTGIALGELQHRGQDASGMALLKAPAKGKKQQVVHIRGHGLVEQVYAHHSAISRTDYPFAIGHNRYQTSGEQNIHNVHPHKLRIEGLGDVYIAHNGNLSNAAKIRARLAQTHTKFQSTVDTELLLHLMAQEASKASASERRNPDFARIVLQKALNCVEGSFSLVVLTKNKAFAVRDPNGFRPLSIGGNPGKTLFIASETCAFDRLKVPFIRDIDPGELLEIELNPDGTCGARQSHTLEHKAAPTLCSLEYPYFALPTSTFKDPHTGHRRFILEVRRVLGKKTCEEISAHLNIDNLAICPIPDSGIHSGHGLADGLHRSIAYGLIRNRYAGRSFLQNSTDGRLATAKNKRMVFPPDVAGKRILLVDDSVIRGNTLLATVEELLAAGALDVSAAITAPLVKHGCAYGIDLPSRKDLLANRYPDLKEMARALKLANIFFLSLEAFKDIIGPGHCYACFDGNFPTSVEGLNV